MNYTTIRITKKTHNIIKNLAKLSNLSLNSIVDKSVQYFGEKYFWDECQKAYTKLYNDKKLSNHEAEERKDWEATLLDDID